MKPLTEKYATHSLVSTLLTGILTSVHHAYEIGYLAFVLGLVVVVLPALSMQWFRQTGSKAALWIFRLLTAWLVIGFGLADGLWNHVIKTLGFYYVLLPAHGGDAKVVERTFSILPPAVGNFIFEGTGILTFVAGLFAAYYAYKFAKQRKQFETINTQTLSGGQYV